MNAENKGDNRVLGQVQPKVGLKSTSGTVLDSLNRWRTVQLPEKSVVRSSRHASRARRRSLKLAHTVLRKTFCPLGS